ncbi:MAG: hypothetical protein E7058_05555 [Lentisphaerae bacterium]|nr:hypothetical protein [Lentisphaerota bacterium]
MMKKFLLAIVLFCAIMSVSAACSVKKTEYSDGQPALVMENSRIKVVILPGSNGRIAELAIKEEDDERHFFPEVVFSTVEVGNGISLVGKTNFAGLEDWGWEEGLIKKNVPYTAEIIKNTPDEVTVKMSAVFSSWANLERSVTISRDSAVVKVATALTNVAKERMTRSFWQHIMVDFDRGMDLDSVRLFIPVKQTGEMGKVLDVAYLQQPGKDCVLDRPAVCTHALAQDYSRLAQPWRAMVHDDLLFGMVVDPADFRGEGVAYHYTKDVLSCENIFPKTAYQPGEKHVFRSEMIAAYFPGRVDYLDKNVVLGVSRSVADGKVVLTVSGYRTGAQKNFRLSFSAADARGNILETAACEAELPAAGEAFSKALTFAKAGNDSRFFVEISAGNKKLARSELLPQVAW